MLFIHGDQDDFVPTYMVYQLYDAKPAPKELWITPGVDHANSYFKYPEEYTARIKSFTEKYIPWYLKFSLTQNPQTIFSAWKRSAEFSGYPVYKKKKDKQPICPTRYCCPYVLYKK